MHFYQLVIFQKLLKAKAHMGSSLTFSASQPAIYGFRNNIAIINLEKTLLSLRRACNVLDLIIKSKGHILFINSNEADNTIIKETAKRCNQSYINNKWIGGFLTNWNHMKTVQNHIHQFSFHHFPSGTSKKQSTLNTAGHPAIQNLGNLSKIPKSAKNLSKHSLTQSKFDLATASNPRFKTMQAYFEGTYGLSQKRPDCVIIFNANQNSAAIREASQNKIPIISIVHPNIPNENHDLITYPIPANENSLNFTYLVCNCFLKTILNAQKNLH